MDLRAKNMDVKGKIIVVSNRNVDKNRHDEGLFGDDLNPKGSEQLNIALAQRETDPQSASNWQLELLSNPTNPSYRKPKLFETFKSVMRQIEQDRADGAKPVNWLVFTHGFNQSLDKNLRKCEELASYGVNVITFSWPSNPGPQEFWLKHKEYQRAVKNAKRSVVAFERFLEFFCTYVNQFQSAHCEVNLNFIVHSLGNFLVEEFVKSSTYDNEFKVFSNVILHQGDADSYQHELWVAKIVNDARVYITINDKDYVLAGSDVVNPNRLGNSSDNCVMQQAKYFDFTDGEGVGVSHRPWFTPGKSNPAVGEFFTKVLNGHRGEHADGWQYVPAKNYYKLD